MSIHELPPLPGVDPAAAPLPGEPGYDEWIERYVYSPEGIDRSLIWENLHRTPSERLRVMQDLIDTFRVGDRGDGPVR